MSRKTSISVALVLMLALPTVLVVAPAATAQQESVPGYPDVAWNNLVGLRQDFHLRFPDQRAPDGSRINQPDCTGADANPADSRVELDFSRSSAKEARTDERAECFFNVGTSAPGGGTLVAGTDVVFRMPPLQRDINVSGDDTIWYHHRGTIPAGVTLEVTLSEGIGSATYTNDGTLPITNPGPLAIPVSDVNGKKIDKGATILLTLRARAEAGDGVGAQWGIDDTGALLEFHAIDAVRAATWVVDEKGERRDLFRPLDANATLRPLPRIQTVFGVDSAFGWDDAKASTPNFTLLRNGLPENLTKPGEKRAMGDLNYSLSDDQTGMAVWTLPGGGIDYRGYHAGEYVVKVDVAYFQGGSFISGNEHKFRIAAQSVRLTPYDDNDTSTLPTPLEDPAHTVLPGSTTTYLLLVNNTGSVNDTFRMRVQQVSATPSIGWSASLGGPYLLGDLVELAPRESKLVTLTVASPAGAPSGANAIFAVNATSVVDPTVRSEPFLAVTTVGSEVRHQVGVVSPGRDHRIDPGVEHDFPVFVWNRGTRPANISLEIQGGDDAAWRVGLVQGGALVDRIVASSVAPGGIHRATLRVVGPVDAADARLSLTLNATSVDVSGVSFDAPMNFALHAVAGVRVEILNSVGAVRHVAEMDTLPLPNPDPAIQNPANRADAHGVQGHWFRTWITNTGKIKDTFELSLESIRSDSCNDAAFDPPRTRTNERFQIYTRGINGGYNEIGSVELSPRETAEVYVWRSVSLGASTCDDPYTFVVAARGSLHRAVGRAEANITTADDGGSAAVLIEPVSRHQDYAQKPLVDIANMTRNRIEGGIRVNDTTIYHVRLTSASNYQAYREDDDRVTPNITVTLEHVDKEQGWNASIRPRNGITDEEQNPWRDHYHFNPRDLNNRWEAWSDIELEIRVQSPTADNKTALAGEQDQFNIRAVVNGTSAVSTMEVKTVVARVAEIQVKAAETLVHAHPGEPGAFLLTVYNNGSTEGLVTLRGSMDPETTPRAGEWTVEPAAQSFPLRAFTNRTVALLVTPPASVTQGATGALNLRVESVLNPDTPWVVRNETMSLAVQVDAPGTLNLVPTGPSEVTVEPSRPDRTSFANFTLTLSNTGSLPVTYRTTATPIPNWTAQLAPAGESVIQPGETRSVYYVLQVPFDILNDTRYASVVRVEEVGNPANFDTVPLTVSILGGSPFPSITVPKVQKTVDRAGIQYFEVNVKNLGGKAGVFGLEARSGDPAWLVGVQDSRGNNITSVRLEPNELVPINVTVRAPFTVPENTMVPVEVIAYSQDLSLSARGVLQALVHDYGVDVRLDPPRVEAIAGVPIDFVLKLKNTGNDNDTLNVSAILRDDILLREWNVQFTSDRARLEPGQEVDIRATVRPPTQPLPTARDYTFKFFAGSLGGVPVNVSKNDTLTGVVTVLPYRAIDVDGDDQVEVAVDLDKRSSNGFEAFREISGEGLQTRVTATSLLDGRTRFFLDVPSDGSYDGVADVWFDPETVYAYRIQHAIDLNQDGSPDYLLDMDRDGKLDGAFDSATERYWDVLEIKLYGKDDPRLQYLVDINADRKPDRYFDPETGKVTITQRATKQGEEVVGIDVDDDKRVDKYYNTRTKDISEATVSNFGTFAVQYWYFFVAFLALAIVTIALIARRRRA